VKLTGMFKEDTVGSTRMVVRLAEMYTPSDEHPIGTEVFIARVYYETLGLTPDDTIQVSIKRAKVRP
jgi:hypothetical protein